MDGQFIEQQEYIVLAQNTPREVRQLNRQINNISKNALSSRDLRPIQRQLNRPERNFNLDLRPKFNRDIQRRDISLTPNFNRDVQRNITRNHDFGVGLLTATGGLFSNVISNGAIAVQSFIAAGSEILAAYFMSPAREKVFLPSISNAIYGVSLGAGLALQDGFTQGGLFYNIGSDLYYGAKNALNLPNVTPPEPANIDNNAPL